MNVVATSKDPSVRVRFPKEILKKVSAAAKQNGRSRNSEIVHRLATSLDPQLAAPVQQ